MPELARGLGLGLRTLRRYQESGLFGPSVPAAGRRAAQYDPLVVCRALLEERRAAQSPRDRRDISQAELNELRLARERRELLPRREVIEDGQAAIQAVVAALKALPARLLQGSAIEQSAVPAVEEVVHESLREMAAWRTRVELLAAVDDEEPAA